MNVLDQKQREQLLYGLLFESANEGILIANEKGEIELVNDRICELFGYSTEEMLLLNVDNLLPKNLRATHVNHRTSYMEAPRKRAMGSGYNLTGERKDGSLFPLEISLNYYKEAGSTRVMALVLDITLRREQEQEIKTLNFDLERKVEQRTKELRESQKLYSLIARNFPNGTINVLDKNFNYIFVEGEELYKYGITGEKLVGKNYIKRLPEEVKQTIQEKISKVFKGQNLSFEIDHQGNSYQINAVGLLDSENVISSVLLVEQNISQRKAAEEQTKEALAKEKQLNELKSRFVSLASHEFRTPLSSVLSSLTLIEKYDQIKEPDKKLKHYKRIRQSVRHLTNILNDFLSLEKVEAGKIYVSMNEFNAHELFKELADQHQEIAKTGQQIQLTYSGDDLLESDQNMLRIIISNLLSNAIKYSGEKSLVKLNAELNSDALNFTVIDQGIGIPKDEQKNLFERFFRAKNAINVEGTGLGLNIVSKYIQLLDGTIRFESEVNTGSIFNIEIPNNRIT